MFNAEDVRRRKNAKRGLQLSILVIGQKGLGKKTFLNNLCDDDELFDISQDTPNPKNAHLNPELKITRRSIQLTSNKEIPIQFDVILAPGCGDSLDETKTVKIITGYVDQHFDAVLDEENRVKRNTRGTDNRPHVCVYFLRPTNRGLKEFDIQLMKSLGEKVSIIPVIGKADMLTEEELLINKELIMTDIRAHEINVFDFKNDTLEDSLFMLNDVSKDILNSELPLTTKINDIIPFALVCNNKSHPTKPGMHIREYEWSDPVVVEDNNTSDFIYLKGILQGSHIQELRDYATNVLYENYRTQKLLEIKLEGNKMSDVEQCNQLRSSCGNKCVELMHDNRLTDMQNNTIDLPLAAKSYSQGGLAPTYDHNSTNKSNIPDDIQKELEEKNLLIAAYKKKLQQLENMMEPINPVTAGSPHLAN